MQSYVSSVIRRVVLTRARLNTDSLTISLHSTGVVEYFAVIDGIISICKAFLLGHSEKRGPFLNNTMKK